MKLQKKMNSNQTFYYNKQATFFYKKIDTALSNILFLCFIKSFLKLIQKKQFRKFN